MIPPLHVVVPDRAARLRGFLPTAFTMLERAAGRLALHLRLKDTPGRRIHALAAELSAAADRRGGWCVVNERVDVAMTAGAGSVQLGAAALSPAAVRRIAGEHLRIGVSVHGADGAERAEREGANHVVVGTIFESPSHPGRTAAGPDLLQACRRRVDLPIVAIGGVTVGRVEEVLGAGADAVAVLSAVWDDARPTAAVEDFLEALPARPGSAERAAGSGERLRDGTDEDR